VVIGYHPFSRGVLIRHPLWGGYRNHSVHIQGARMDDRKLARMLKIAGLVNAGTNFGFKQIERENCARVSARRLKKGHRSLQSMASSLSSFLCFLSYLPSSLPPPLPPSPSHSNGITQPGKFVGWQVPWGKHYDIEPKGKS
jgi:hypothetical protein